MSTLKLKGSTSGYVEITAPAIAGDNQITLPTTAGTITVKDASGNTQVGTGVTIGSPSANVFTLSTGGGERLRVDNSGTIIAGVTTVSAGSASAPSITPSGDSNTGIFFPAADTIAFAEGGVEAVRIDSSGNLTISNGNLVFSTSGKGIDFSATANSGGTMTSELLSDYEEGSFTPTLTGSVSNPTVTYNTGSTWGYYTKIGERVFVDIEVRTTAFSGGSGELRISGLPFNASSRNSNVLCWESTVQTYNITFDSTYIWTAEVAASQSYFVIRGGSSGGTGANLQVGAWSNTNPTLIRITGSYTV